MPSITLTPEQLDFLASPRAVRERAEKVFARATLGGTSFRLNLAKLPEAARLVGEVTRRNYPDLTKIPFHARWEHFQAGGHDRLKDLDQRLLGLDPEARARAKIDLAVVSVLLDAGAGATWKYRDGTRGTYTRSEGLALASFEMFLSGAFSSDPHQPLRVDSRGLAALSVDTLARGFQVDAHNPLLGLEGRCELLQRLGAALEKRSEIFGNGRPSRPGNLVDFFNKTNPDGRTTADAILSALLIGFQDMWTPRTTVNGVGFGDLWVYDFGGGGLKSASAFENLVPFHKLSQWLSYSLIQPFEEAGRTVVDPGGFTGLPEYRNGGLFLDTGVLELKNPAEASKRHQPGDPLIIEWRALTVALLDRLGELVRKDFGLSAEEFPLGKVLQGGTWSAGRETAAKLRGGLPPLDLESDGTVF